LLLRIVPLQVGRDDSFTLDGGGSSDPDESSAPFTFAWGCMQDVWACAGVDTSTSTAALTVPELALEIGLYAFTLTVSKGARFAAATTTVEVIAGSPPAIIITGAHFVLDCACANAAYFPFCAWVSRVEPAASLDPSQVQRRRCVHEACGGGYISAVVLDGLGGRR
jgi:hypothetical protein